MSRFYLSDAADTQRLSTSGKIAPAHACETQYFDDADSAYAYCNRHPAGASLTIRASSLSD